MSSISKLPSGIQLQILREVVKQEVKQPSMDVRDDRMLFKPSSCHLDYQRTAAACFGLAHHGYHVVDGFLEDADAASVRDACLLLLKAGKLRQARMGKKDVTIHSDLHLRGDLIKFISKDGYGSDTSDCDNILSSVRGKLDAFASSLSSFLGLKLHGKALQIGYYAKGTRYVRHRDASPLIPDRRITAILYLNPSWSQEMGGQLRLHLTGSEPTEILPQLGRLLLFKSEIEHEVKETMADRFAITMWLYSPSDVNPYIESFALHASQRIFVSVAAFRDPDCNDTIISLLDSAAFPSRIVVGVLYQDDESEDAGIHSALPLKYSDSIVARRIKSSEARGPAYARHWIVSEMMLQIRGISYYLQLDSHMRFSNAWDVSLISLLLRAPNPRSSIVTFYPPDFNTASPPFGPIIMHQSELDGDGLPRVTGKLVFPSPTPITWDDGVVEPADLIRQRYVAAGFLFGPVEAANIIYGIDKHSDALTISRDREWLSGLFFGEEAAISARLWTHGWELWCPRDSSTSLAFHKWSRDGRKTFWDVVMSSPPLINARRVSQRRVRVLLGLDSYVEGDPELECLRPGERLGAGVERTIADFTNFSQLTR